jgi:hypothetical protein
MKAISLLLVFFGFAAELPAVAKACAHTKVRCCAKKKAPPPPCCCKAASVQAQPCGCLHGAPKAPMEREIAGPTARTSQDRSLALLPTTTRLVPPATTVAIAPFRRPPAVSAVLLLSTHLLC